MSEKNFSVFLQVRNPVVKSDLEEIILSMKGFRVNNSGGQTSCDLLILELGEDPQEDFKQVYSILSSELAKEVFLTSSRLEPELLIQALRVGAKEFLPQPIKRDEVREALLRFVKRREKIQPPKEEKKRGRLLISSGAKVE